MLTFNQALLGKRLWRYAAERETFWRQVVDKNFDRFPSGWCYKVVTGPYGVSLRKRIRRGWDSFSSFINIEVGDGSRTRFWHDIWCGNHPLKDSFQELFGIARDRDALVANHMFAQWRGTLDMNLIKIGAWMGGGFCFFFFQCSILCEDEGEKKISVVGSF